MSSEGDSMAHVDDKGASRDTGTLGKLMVLLDLVTHADAPLRFTDILALADQPRGTLHRQLGHLVVEGLLELDAEGRYAPGLRLLDFASRSWARNEFRLIAAPHLAALHRETGETVAEESETDEETPIALEDEEIDIDADVDITALADEE